MRYVSSGRGSSETVTCSRTVAGIIRTVNRVTLPIEITIASFTYAAKPGDSTRSSYRPNGSSSARNAPPELEENVRVRLVSRFRSTIVAPGTALPVGSTTLPAIAPATLDVCATAGRRPPIPIATTANASGSSRAAVNRYMDNSQLKLNQEASEQVVGV